MPAAGIRPRIAVPAATEPAPPVSPNHSARRGGVLPDMIVLHHTAMASAAAAHARLCDPEAEVSAHYLIDERGGLRQLVPEALRAWHAGAGRWGAVRDVNSRSIGIELANRGDDPYPAPQVAALEELMRGIMARWRIPPERVIAHSDMAPGRKTDPGRRFDWRGLARAGLSVWSDADGSGPGGWPEFERGAAWFGYPVGDVAREYLLSAFRLRFRPWATGPLMQADCARMADLAARFAVDQRGPSA